MTEHVIDLCRKYNIPFHFEDRVCNATGIGDLLFWALAVKNNLIPKPIYINLLFFTVPYYNQDPINQLEFRIKLIKDLIKYNNIDENDVKFVFSHNREVCQMESKVYSSLTDFNLKIMDTQENDDNEIGEEYIIFHTKCRHVFNYENIEILKENIQKFCKDFKSEYKIIIMGERSFPYNQEVDLHGITTVYSELIELKTNNVIIDKTIENLYSNLDYDNYLNDVKLIKNAKYNICFGIGNSLVTSLMFGKSVMTYCNAYDKYCEMYCNSENFMKKEHFKKNNFYCKDIFEFFNLIKEKIEKIEKIVPCLGIGDILRIKMIEISNKLQIKDIVINEELIHICSSNYQVKLNTIKEFIKFMFPTSFISVGNECVNFYTFINKYKITQLYIYDYIKDSIKQKINVNEISNKYSNYIIFHTKLRQEIETQKDDVSLYDINKIIPQLNNFFKNFKTSKTILIMGERSIEVNFETIACRTTSLYNNLLLLNINNNVIDLTQDVLTSGNPSFDSFLTDIEIINKASCNICFGIGGPFAISSAFSIRQISFVPFLNITPYKEYLLEMNSVQNSIVTNIEELNALLRLFEII